MKKILFILGFICISCSLPAQNVGIGTSTPVGKLHIKGNADTTQLLIDAYSVQSNGSPLIKLRNSDGNELLRIHSDDTSNVFIGRNAGRLNVPDLAIGGFANTFTGSSAGYSNSTGYSNTASGASALYSNTAGSENTAYGVTALSKNITGFGNVANGTNALSNNTTGSQNTATGIYALWQNTTSDYNTANGARALPKNRTGYQNTACGSAALFDNTTGYNNTAVGTNALSNNIGGFNNIAIGYNSGTDAAAANIFNTISIGNAGWMNGYQNQVFIGNAGTGWIGGWKPWSVYSDGRLKKNITEDVGGLVFIKKLRPVTYELKSEEALIRLTGNILPKDYIKKTPEEEPVRQTGFIAQEVATAARESGYAFSGVSKVKTGKEMYSLSYESFVVPLVKAMQEQQMMIESQQTQITLLEKRLALLEAKQVIPGNKRWVLNYE